MRYALALLVLTSLLLRAEAVPFDFRGNDTLESRELYDALGFGLPYFYQFWKEAPALDPFRSDAYARALEAYYKSRGFYHTRVRVATDETMLTFVVDEGPAVEVADVTLLSPWPLQEQLELEVSERFDAQTFVEDKQRLMTFASDRGYCNAELHAKAWIDNEENRAYLLYELDPKAACRFGKIETGETPGIAPWLSRSFLRFKEGDRYSSEKIRQSYDMLYAQSGVAKAVIEEGDHNGSSVPITLHVSAREEPVRFRAGIGMSSDEGVVLQAGIIHRNLWENLKTLSLDGRYSQIKEEIKSTFTMPLPDHNLLGVTLGYKNEKFEGYQERSNYLTPYLQQYDQPHAFKEGLLLDHALTYASSDETLFPESELTVTSLFFNWKYDIRNKLLEPTRGYYLFSNLQGSLESALSDSTYMKALVGGGRLFSRGSHVFALKAQLGSIRLYQGDLPSSYRFYAGGMNSNRAYAYRMLGPTNSDGDPIGFQSLFEGTAEYRFPLYGPLRGVLFNDTTLIGQDYLPDQNRPYVAVGTGLRYATPVGPFAIDIGCDAKDPSQYAIHFHIGELF